MGFRFSVHVPDIPDEEAYMNIQTIEKSIRELALAKARSVTRSRASSLILGCDTVVVLDRTIMGKPADYSDALKMLKTLSGRVHKVFSGVALICDEIRFEQTAFTSTDVWFRTLAEEEIIEYLSLNEYADKAGAYAIQGRAMTFIDKIKGCFYNVMGLPMSDTIHLFNSYQEFLKGSNQCKNL
jgi:septum formation protein